MSRRASRLREGVEMAPVTYELQLDFAKVLGEALFYGACIIIGVAWFASRNVAIYQQYANGRLTSILTRRGVGSYNRRHVHTAVRLGLCRMTRPVRKFALDEVSSYACSHTGLHDTFC